MTTTPKLWKGLTQVNTTDAGAAQDGGQIVALDDGGYEIIWTDNSLFCRFKRPRYGPTI